MAQVALFLAGERDYAAIKGGTGPLVYPAGHVYIYAALHRLTAGGADVARAQWLFAALYLATLALVLGVYREARAPPYILPLLAASRRLHSIYVLRLFNDPFAVLLLVAAVLLWQRRMWTLGSLAYALSVGVKMSSLLVLPAVGALLLQAVGRDRALRQAIIMAQVQALLATPFIVDHPRSYLAGAFEFTRRFFYQWTVNWRFVPEEVFLSPQFSLALLGVHAVLLLAFLATKWSRYAPRPENVATLTRAVPRTAASPASSTLSLIRPPVSRSGSSRRASRRATFLQASSRPTRSACCARAACTTSSTRGSRGARRLHCGRADWGRRGYMGCGWRRSGRGTCFRAQTRARRWWWVFSRSARWACFSAGGARRRSRRPSPARRSGREARRLGMGFGGRSRRPLPAQRRGRARTYILDSTARGGAGVKA